MFEKRLASDDKCQYIDYQMLNVIMQRDAFPLPSGSAQNMSILVNTSPSGANTSPKQTSELLDTNRQGTPQHLSKLDLSQGFHQVLLSPDDHAKSAFITPDGQYLYMIKPYGLRCEQQIPEAHDADPPGFAMCAHSCMAIASWSSSSSECCGSSS